MRAGLGLVFLCAAALGAPGCGSSNSSTPTVVGTVPPNTAPTQQPTATVSNESDVRHASAANDGPRAFGRSFFRGQRLRHRAGSRVRRLVGV